METVIPLFPRKDEWCEGKIHCLECGHKYHGVGPVNVRFFECPECHCFKALFTYPVVPEEYWTCVCENALFYITKEGITCPKCGQRQDFTDG